MQRNWIGRSEGAEVDLPLRGARPRLPGLHHPPRHALRRHLLRARARAPRARAAGRRAPSTRQAVREYVNRVGSRESAEERGDEDREKTGVPLGRTVTNPVNGEQIPMFVADYVLMEYGTGAIMAVPGPRRARLRVRHGLRPADPPRDRGRRPRAARDDEGLPYAGDGPMVNSGRFDGKHNREAYDEIVDWLAAEGRGRPAVNYRLRDWLVSRQRYWGAPIPIVYCDECGIVPVPEDQLPVAAARHRGLRAARARARWPRPRTGSTTECPQCGGAARRETDTMDTFVDSSWYFLRYLDPRNDEAAWDREVGRLLDAGRPVHRRRRARDPAPDVRALLHQGARRHGPARRRRSRSPTSSPRG